MMPVLPAVVEPFAGLTGWPFISQSSTAAPALAATHKNGVRPHFLKTGDSPRFLSRAFNRV
jgi:hypothetical protein